MKLGFGVACGIVVAAAPPSIRIPTKGFTRRDWALQAVALGTGLLPFLLLIPGIFPQTMRFSIALAEIGWVFMIEAVFVGRFYLYAVEIRGDGVTFCFPFLSR